MYIPALSCLISATSEIFCVQLEDTFGEKKMKLIFFTQRFPASFSGTERQGMRILHMEDVGHQADSAGCHKNRAGKPRAAQL